ncbi:MAG TPA: glycosyltransferase family A protein [Polyangiaceae bacterium]
MSEPELFSCLCVTENRPAFVHWFLWAFDRQTWPCKELVIVDSSDVPIETTRSDVRVIRADAGTLVSRKRNVALEMARGKFIAWFDDDDWSHPERLRWLAEAMMADASMAGATRAWFVDLWGSGCRRYFGGDRLVFNTAGFRADVARSAVFDETLRKGSDTIWMRQLERRHAASARTIPSDSLTLWLCHDQNLSNPRSSRTFPVPLSRLESLIGPAAWGETGAELAGLRARLGPRPAAPRLASAPVRVVASSGDGRAAPKRRSRRRLYRIR